MFPSLNANNIWKYVMKFTVSRASILDDTSNVTDTVFAIFSNLCKTFKPKFQGSAKNI